MGEKNSGMKENAKFTMTVEATTDNLYQVLGFLDERLEEAGCLPTTQMRIDLVVEELFVNVAHYAYAPGKGEFPMIRSKRRIPT